MGGVVVLVSGGGTTLQNLLDAQKSGCLEADIRLAIADRPCNALARAEKAGVRSLLIDRKAAGEGLSTAILEAIPHDASLVILGGFLSILRAPMVDSFYDRMINIHPSLLPRHGGAGMYGYRVHESVLASGDAETGCTVHYVDHGTDTGRVILQRRCPVFEDDTPATLQQRVSELELEAIVTGANAALRTIAGVHV